MKIKLFLTLMILSAIACNTSASNPTVESFPVTEEFVLPDTTTPESFTPTIPPVTATFTEIPPTATNTPLPILESIKATVIADKLVCRYGPGANYLYLIAFNRTTPVRLIGRADGNNWVLVENSSQDSQDCWVNGEFVQAESDMKQLKVVYPNEFKLIVSPYYGATTVLSATREGDEITVSWIEIIVSPGKYEDENMFPYIVEVWHCVNGEFIFETLGSTYPAIKFTDQQGCDQASHGRVYIQEKHGYAGPADIPWP
jgi:uncharacterized protein YgiM (DUF1202 family)